MTKIRPRTQATADFPKVFQRRNIRHAFHETALQYYAIIASRDVSGTNDFALGTRLAQSVYVKSGKLKIRIQRADIRE